MSDDKMLLATLNQPNTLAMGNDADLRPFFAALGIEAGGAVAALNLSLGPGSNLVELTIKRYVTRGQLYQALAWLTEHANGEGITDDTIEVVKQKLEALTQKETQ